MRSLTESIANKYFLVPFSRRIVLITTIQLSCIFIKIKRFVLLLYNLKIQNGGLKADHSTPLKKPLYGEDFIRKHRVLIFMFKKTYMSYDI